MHIQDDAAFIQVGMDEGEAQLLCTYRQQGSHLPARIAPWRLDLDDVRAKVAQHAAHVGSKWFGNIQHTNPVESPARLVTLGDFHVSSLGAVSSNLVPSPRGRGRSPYYRNPYVQRAHRSIPRALGHLGVRCAAQSRIMPPESA